MKRFAVEFVTQTSLSSKTTIAKVMSRVVKNFLVTQLLAFVTGRSLLDLEPSMRRLLRGFQSALLWHFFKYFRLSGPGRLISLTLSCFDLVQ